ncbi:MAG: multinuclear nonheme iron-dependent oxidase [Nannocystales bacterium]
MPAPFSQSVTHRIGCGYTPAIVDGHLDLPPYVEHLEAGWNAIGCEKGQALASIKHRSVHLSRAPVCERPPIQDAFLDDVLERAPPCVDSIGVHLCGPYRSGMGWLGAGPAYVSTEDNDRAARRFFDTARERLPWPILIENANFYDVDLGAIRRAWALANALCATEGISMVLDLAHLCVHARNCGISSTMMLGFVDLDLVSCIHLSGVKKDRRGVWHDAHGEPLAEEVLELLCAVLRVADQPLTVVVEHTDPVWAERPEGYRAEFDRVAELVANTRRRTPVEVDEERVAVGLLNNLIFARREPQLHALLGPSLFRSIVGEWADQFILERKAAPHEIPSFGEHALARAGASIVDPLHSFRNYVHERVQRILADRSNPERQ